MKIRKLQSVIPPRAASGKQRTADATPATSATSTTTSRANGGTVPLTLKLVAPSAKHVYVAGSFNNWHAAALPLKAAGGEWSGEVKLAPGRYEYLFVVDGKWLPDPGATEKIPNPFGGFNSLLSVS